jgi:hypothetical protein
MLKIVTEQLNFILALVSRVTQIKCCLKQAKQLLKHIIRIIRETQERGAERYSGQFSSKTRNKYKIYVEQKFKPLLLQSITIDAKQSLYRSLPHTPFTSFATLHLMQKSGWAGPPFIERDKRRTVE